MSLETTVREAFKKRFGGEPAAIVRAPGRVNLIGEHTDYNAGFVMPMAIDFAVWVALRPRADQEVRAYSLDYPDHPAEFSLTDIPHPHKQWTEYVTGVAHMLQTAGHTLKGWDGVVVGDVPRGAGLSSSAAIELAIARAFAHISGIKWDKREMALLCQRVENEWVGKKSGIMDQMISASGEKGYALKIDCRDLSTELVPLPEGLSVVILDTDTKHDSKEADLMYNERRTQCEQAAAHFGVKALRDVTLDQLVADKNQLDPIVYKRAYHIITENARVEQALEAMKAGDIARFGVLLNASHDSLRDDYEVTKMPDDPFDALDIMVQCARAHAACIGSRMTGGGFGGCAIAVVRDEAIESFKQQVSAEYQRKTNKKPSVYVSTPQDGARVVYSQS